MRIFVSAVCALALLAQAGPAAAAAFHDSKRVLNVGMNSTTDCVYFRLDGVTVADSDVAGEYFTLIKSHRNFQQLYAILLSAKAAALPVNVTTTGAAGACGYAEVAAMGLAD